MALVAAVTNGNYTHNLYVDLVSQDIGANTSVVSYSYQIVRNVSAANGSWWGSPGRDFSVGIDGLLDTENKTHDFRSSQVLTAVTGSKTVSHNADGTKSIYSSFDGPLTYVSAGFPRTSGGGWFTLPTIPRASTPTVTGGTSFDAGTTITINTNRASTSFTHTLTYAFGTQSGTIATGIGDSTTWTPPMSLLNEIPNAVSGTGTFTLTTFSGGTNVGSKTLQFTLRAPSTVVPSVGTLSHSEATTSPAVATLIGAYVENVSKLALSVSGSAGIYGSTISAHKIEVAGQTINAASGTTGVIAQDGTVPIVVTVTDSRGRTASSTTNVTVLNYASPSIPTATAVRSTAGGVADPNGTSLKVDVATSVTSLVVGTQKNNLTWSIKVRQRGSATAWTSIANAAGATVVGTGYTGTSILSTYSTANSYEVRIAAVDKLGTEASVVLLVGTGGAVMHMSKTVDGVGIGKYHEQGSVDALGQMYQNNGERVASESYVPPGTVVMTAAGSAPTGWLLCQGQAVSRTTYAALYAALGGASSPWGQGDGSTTFNVPDMRARVPVGVNPGGDADFGDRNYAGGARTHTLTESQMPTHWHNVGADGGNDGTLDVVLAQEPSGGTLGGWTIGIQSTTPGIRAVVTDRRGGGGAHNNLQPYRALHFIIRT